MGRVPFCEGGTTFLFVGLNINFRKTELYGGKLVRGSTSSNTWGSVWTVEDDVITLVIF